MKPATDMFSAKFKIEDRDQTLEEMKMEARGRTWLRLQALECTPAGSSVVTVDHEEATVIVQVPVVAPEHLPRKTIQPL